MKTKTFEEILALGEVELVKEIEKAEKKLFEVKMAVIAGQDSDSSKPGKMKKYLARLKTAQNQIISKQV